MCPMPVNFRTFDFHGIFEKTFSCGCILAEVLYNMYNRVEP